MSACDAPGGSIIEIGSPGAIRITTKTMTATPKRVISVVTPRVRIPRSAFKCPPDALDGAGYAPAPHPRSGGGEPPKAMEGANADRGVSLRPLHRAAHGPPPPSHATGEEPPSASRLHEVRLHRARSVR